MSGFNQACPSTASTTILQILQRFRLCQEDYPCCDLDSLSSIAIWFEALSWKQNAKYNPDGIRMKNLGARWSKRKAEPHGQNAASATKRVV